MNLHSGSGGAARGGSPSSASSSKTSTKRKSESSAGGSRPKAIKKDSNDNIPTRRSNRLSTAAQSDPVAAEELAKRQREEEEAAELERQRAKRAKHEDRLVSAIKRTGTQWSDDEESQVASNGLIKLLGDASKLEVLSPTKSEYQGGYTPDGKRGKPAGRKSVSSDPAVKQLTKQFANMDVKKFCKATPDRVYSMAVHPSVVKELVFVGDKNGRLGICDMTDPDHEDEEEEDHKDAFAIQAHAKGAISGLRLAPHEPHTVSST